MKRCLLITTIFLFSILPLQGQNLDYTILCSLQQRRTPQLDKTMRLVSNSLVLAPAIPAGMLLGGWIGKNEPLLSSGAQVGTSLLATGGVTIGLKYLVGRKRPYQKYPEDLVSVTQEPDPSFPSGHTSFAFSTATSLCLQYPQWYVITPSLLWAGAVGFSRLYLGVHFPSDVLTGMLIGATTAYVTYQVQRRRQQAIDAPNVKGFVLPVTITF